MILTPEEEWHEDMSDISYSENSGKCHGVPRKRYGIILIIFIKQRNSHQNGCYSTWKEKRRKNNSMVIYVPYVVY